jgi:hypothetical protein
VDRDLFTFNDNFYRIFRTTAAAVGGYQMSAADCARRFCHPDDIPLVGQTVRATNEATDPNYSVELEHRILYADGGVGYIAVRIFVVKNAQGRTVRTYGVNHDITEQKRVQEQMAKQIDELRRWHELTLGREMRIVELKREVNELLVKTGQLLRYGSVEEEHGFVKPAGGEVSK